MQSFMCDSHIPHIMPSILRTVLIIFIILSLCAAACGNMFHTVLYRAHGNRKHKCSGSRYYLATHKKTSFMYIWFAFCRQCARSDFLCLIKICTSSFFQLRLKKIFPLPAGGAPASALRAKRIYTFRLRPSQSRRAYRSTSAGGCLVRKFVFGTLPRAEIINIPIAFLLPHFLRQS